MFFCKIGRCFFGVFVFIGLIAFGSCGTIKKFFNKGKTISLDTLETTKNSKESYQKLIENAKIDSGFIHVIRKKQDYYFEIPLLMMNRDLLLINKVSSVPYELNDAGIAKGINFENKLIRFTLKKEIDRVWVSELKGIAEATPGDAIAQSVRDNFTPSVFEFFEIESYNADSTAVVIKVNKIFDGTEKSFNDVFAGVGIGVSAKTALSAITHIKSFEKNLVARSLLSTRVVEKNTPAAISLGVTSNIYLLPVQAMQGRFADDRVGYFTTPKWYFSDKQQQMERRNLVTRWRLEPKLEERERYKKGELVAPQTPIVFYIDNATPAQWRSYIKQGILDWQKAFEQAGFCDAILVKEIPDSTDFDLDDATYSVFTYAASPKANAMGPSVVDPRSGEILEADIIWWHNVMKSLHSWMQVQTGVIDTGARANVFSEEKMGKAIRFATSHEVGHSLGLKHNMGASYAFPVDSLRSPSFTAKMGGTAPSIMDYARFNYIAQPGDNIKNTTPKIGVYDTYAINWAYRWLDAKNPWEELPITQKWIAQHQNDPLYRYGEQQSLKGIADPRSQSEDLGDDAIKASTYGLMNLKKLVPQIISWTTKEGETYEAAGKLQMAAIAQWYLYAEHVLANIGGIYLNNIVKGDSQNAYEVIPREKQLRAWEYLKAYALTMPDWLMEKRLLTKTFPLKDSPLGNIEIAPYNIQREMQATLMYSLLSDERLLRMVENQWLFGKEKTWTVEDFLAQIRRHVFALTYAKSNLGLQQRLLQQNYVDALLVSTDRNLEKIKTKNLQNTHQIIQWVLPQVCTVSDSKVANLHNVYVSGGTRTASIVSTKIAELFEILQLLKPLLNKGDKVTRAHYQDLVHRIEMNIK